MSVARWVMLLGGIACLLWQPLPVRASDTGPLWLRPQLSPARADVVVRVSQPGSMVFTMTSLRSQVLDASFRVIGPFGVPVYVIPASPHTFPPGESTITASALALVPGEYRIQFGGQGLLLGVEVPDAPVVISDFVFSSDAAYVSEPVAGDYTFFVPHDVTTFGLLVSIVSPDPDAYVSAEILDASGNIIDSIACGNAASPYPTPCTRLAMDVSPEAAGKFWKLHIQHDGDFALALDTIPTTLANNAASWFQPHHFVIDPSLPNGRDCLSLGGVWNPVTDRCTIQDWWLQPGDVLHIRAAATLVAEGEITGVGTILNHGTLINDGELESLNTFTNHSEFINNGTLINRGFLSNLGDVSNYGALINEGAVENAGTLQNHCSGSIEGDGSFTGNSVLPDGLDGDGDGVCLKADCAPRDALTWSLPGTVGLLELDRDFEGAGTTHLTWGAPLDPGGANIVFDVIRFGVADLAGRPHCVVNDTALYQAEDPATPVAGQVFYYLPIPANDCGVGSAGIDSSGTPRAAGGCS